jgi:hypothetical protein
MVMGSLLSGEVGVAGAAEDVGVDGAGAGVGAGAVGNRQLVFD